MAMLPELSKLRVAPLAGDRAWPILQTENVFILPGVPEFFQSKMEVIADHFLDSRPMVNNFMVRTRTTGQADALHEMVVPFLTALLALRRLGGISVGRWTSLRLPIFSGPAGASFVAAS